MERKDRFQKAYNYLRSKGVIHTQEEVAVRMQSTASNVSKAMKGAESVLTDNFLRRFNEAFDSVFNLQYLILGEGEMLKEGEREEEEVEPVSQNQAVLKLIDEISAQRRLTEKKDEQIDRLLTLLEKEKERTQMIAKQQSVG